MLGSDLTGTRLASGASLGEGVVENANLALGFGVPKDINSGNAEPLSAPVPLGAAAAPASAAFCCGTGPAFVVVPSPPSPVFWSFAGRWLGAADGFGTLPSAANRLPPPASAENGTL